MAKKFTSTIDVIVSGKKAKHQNYNVYEVNFQFYFFNFSIELFTI